MHFYNLKRKKIIILFLLTFSNIIQSEVENSNPSAQAEEQIKSTNSQLRINKIILTRKNQNNYLTDDAIKNCIPYNEGDIFLSNKTTVLIKNIYELGKPFSFFNQIRVMAEELEDNLINLHVITYEKPELKEIIITGNKKVQKKDIDELYEFENIHAINDLDLKTIILEIKKLYRDKDFHLAEIDGVIEKTENNKVTAKIDIKENKKSLIKRVFFKGNNCINDKRLREIIFTREDWLFGFFNKAGSYRPENLETDKHIIESYYKSNGYFKASVTNVDVVMDPTTKQYQMTFYINEGDLYSISDVKIDGNGIISEELLLDTIPLKKGCIYSAKDLRDSIEILRTAWGQYGYAFADIEPIIIPDDINKTINITLNTELGDKVFVNRINIIGNKKTKDYVIRRQLTFQEGDLLTTTKMDQSKDRIENLGYFDASNGANWKINRINEKFVDLDLIVNEVKTGRVMGNMGVGGSPQNIYSLTRSFMIGGTAYDTNLFGEGIQFKLNGQWSKEEWNAQFNLIYPWLFNRPIYGDLDIFYVKSQFGEELRNVSDFNEQVVGGAVGIGFKAPSLTWLNDVTYTFKLGIEDIRNNKRPTVIDSSSDGSATLQTILNRRFQPGNLVYIAGRAHQDTRNHILHPSRGYQISGTYKVGFSGGSGNLGFGKFETEASYYTPLIGENRLILGIHGFAGIISGMDNKDIPYRELFHMGGPASVRGYLFGQIGPTFLGDSIGAKKAFFWNFELIFPITKDFAIKGALFYDGGAGWDTPDINKIPPSNLILLKNNRFEYRQSIGLGVRMLRPTPMKIDWGFKLDRKKGEPESELHFSMYKDF